MGVKPSIARARSAEVPPATVVWHDLECGGYEADLPLWRELARDAAGRAEGTDLAVLDVGAGTGRVALDLLEHGHNVTAVELDPELACALRSRAATAAGDPDAAAAAPRLTVIQADARQLAGQDLGAPQGTGGFQLCIVPMQTLQLLGGPAGRAAFLRGVRGHLAPGGVVACAIVEELDEFDCADGDGGPSAERAVVGGDSYASRAVRVSVEAATIVIERTRVVRGPTGVTSRERDVVILDRLGPATLAAEAEAAGLGAVDVRTVPATADYVGSTVVVLGG